MSEDKPKKGLNLTLASLLGYVIGTTAITWMNLWILNKLNWLPFY